MKRSIAFLWLTVMLIASGYLTYRIEQGLHFHTDLMALLPRDQQDKVAQSINDSVTQSLAQHVLILVGGDDRAMARHAAHDIEERITKSGLFDTNATHIDKDRVRSIGAFYFPYRAGLMTASDRDLLQAGKGRELSARAMAQVFGIFGMADAKLLQNDPFLLLPHFLTGLPLPVSNFVLDDGFMSLQEKGKTWILLSAQLKGDPFSLDTQQKAVAIFDDAKAAQQSSKISVLHLGAVFFAQAGANSAMRETSWIGIISSVGTALLVLMLFRAARPLLLNLLVITTSIIAALAASLYIFGEMHIIALLFGISLIGVSVDYSLQYCCESFASVASPEDRLRRVLVGISIGTATTVIGYLTLCLAPFPGLHQIAIFSAVGLIASWLTVVFWLPCLDKSVYPARGQRLLFVADCCAGFWHEHSYRYARTSVVLLALFCLFCGYTLIHVDDDVRHMQSLSAELTQEQTQIQALTGPIVAGPFITVLAPDEESALQREEMLADHLQPLTAAHKLGGFQSIAQYIPSQARQRENGHLQRTRLYEPFAKEQGINLHLAMTPQISGDEKILKLSDLGKEDGPMPFLSNLRLNGTGQDIIHAVMLEGINDESSLEEATQNIPGVKLVDPVRDYSHLFGEYRNRAVLLLILSAALMLPLLIGRYGYVRGIRVILPSLFALVLTPALRALMGGSFTFFDAMALVLILSIGVDYAVFCAEATEARKPVTLLAVAAAAGTALLSFGLLALSNVEAVHNFGMTMTVGILLSFLFAPLACVPPGSLSRKTHYLLPLLLLLLPSCAEQTDSRVHPLPVAIAPGVTVTLPDPVSLGRSVEATQLVVAHYAGQSFAFEAHISANPSHFLFVGLDPMGRAALRIDWTDDGIFYSKAADVPDQLQPENILADMVLLYWPKGIVRKSLSPSHALLTATTDKRTISLNKVRVWQAEYKTEKDFWSGTLHYRNLSYNYNFEIQSVEILP